MLFICSSLRSLVICKYRNSNMFGNHFRILNAGMVQSVESVWTVLKIGNVWVVKTGDTKINFFVWISIHAFFDHPSKLAGPLYFLNFNIQQFELIWGLGRYPPLSWLYSQKFDLTRTSGRTQVDFFVEFWVITVNTYI